MSTTRPPKRKTLPARYEPGFMRELDGRTEISQRLSAAYDTIIADTGGPASQTHTRRALVERFVFLEAVLQTLEVDIATKPGKTAELLSRWVQAVNSLTGLAKLLGIERRAPDVTDLQAYLSKRTQEDEA